MRLLEAVAFKEVGFLTCHVLDTARGCPAGPGLGIELKRLDETSGEWQQVGSFVKTADGRLAAGPACLVPDRAGLEAVPWCGDVGAGPATSWGKNET